MVYVICSLFWDGYSLTAAKLQAQALALRAQYLSLRRQKPVRSGSGGSVNFRFQEMGTVGYK